MLLLHILTAVVAFAPAFIHPALAAGTKDMGDTRIPMLVKMHGALRGVYGPSLVITGILGFGLQGLSDGAWTFGQVWMILAIIIWLAMVGVVFGMFIPGEAKLAGGDDSGMDAVGRSGAILSVLLLIMLFLMIFKPGI